MKGFEKNTFALSTIALRTIHLLFVISAIMDPFNLLSLTGPIKDAIAQWRAERVHRAEWIYRRSSTNSHWWTASVSQGWNENDCWFRDEGCLRVDFGTSPRNRELQGQPVCLEVHHRRPERVDIYLPCYLLMRMLRRRTQQKTNVPTSKHYFSTQPAIFSPKTLLLHLKTLLEIRGNRKTTSQLLTTIFHLYPPPTLQ